MPHFYFASGKKHSRRARSLDALAVGDSLFRFAANTMIATDRFTIPALDYVTRKREALRAAYFAQRYGRDYWTGRARHPNGFRAQRRAALD